LLRYNLVKWFMYVLQISFPSTAEKWKNPIRWAYPTWHWTGLSEAMLDKPVRPSCPTWGWTILSNPMLDKVVQLVSSMWDWKTCLIPCQTTTVQWALNSLDQFFDYCEVAQLFWATSKWSNHWSNELKLIGQMLSNMAWDRNVWCCAKQTSQTKVFEMGSDNSVPSHVGQACLTWHLKIMFNSVSDKPTGWAICSGAP
jgi:hypothetical protein